MSIEEVYESELWQELIKNRAFNTKFFEVYRRAQYYVEEKDLTLEIKDGKLMLSYITPILEHEYDCQCTSAMRYEFSVNDDGNLLLDEKFGTIRSDFGYDFMDSKGGMVDTQYSCSLYDPDGIELASQSYVDSYALKHYELESCKNDFPTKIETAYNPNLIYFNDYKDLFPKPGVIGETAQYIRRTRSKNELGIVDSVRCAYNKDATLRNFKHELFFNTFLTHQVTFQPELISVVEEDPFAIVDEKGNMHITRRHAAYGLTNDNYQEKATIRFLNELIRDREQLSKEEIEARYDLMISRLEAAIKTKRKN